MKRPEAIEIGLDQLSGVRLHSRRLSRIRLAWLDVLPLVVVGVIALLGLWHLDRYPRTWFDEGSYLEAADNLQRNGTYAAVSGDGTRDYAPIIGVGPTVLGPVAAMLWLVDGDTLQTARLVPFTFLVIATLLLYVLARALYGRLAALCTLLIAATLPALDWIVTGRQVLGEIPAIALLMLGGMLAARASSRPGVVVAGAVLGLTMVTKGQYLLILPLAVIVLAALDRLTGRARLWTWYLTLLCAMGAVYAGWILTLLIIIGEGSIIESFRLLRESSSGALLVLMPERWVAALKLLLGPSSLCIVAPALVTGVWTYRAARGEQRWRIMALLTFQTLWFGWYAFASIAWPRYAFPALALNTVFAGRLVAGLLTTLARARVRPAGAKVPVTALSAVGLALLSVALLLSAWRQFAPIVRADEREPQAFATLIQRTVPPTARIDGWEPEISFLSGHRLQYPPLGSLDRVVRAKWYGSAEQLDFSANLRGEYLIIGPFARWNGIYSEALQSQRYEHIATVGGYELLRRR